MCRKFTSKLGKENAAGYHFLQEVQESRRKGDYDGGKKNAVQLPVNLYRTNCYIQINP